MVAAHWNTQNTSKYIKIQILPPLPIGANSANSAQELPLFVIKHTPHTLTPSPISREMKAICLAFVLSVDVLGQCGNGHLEPVTEQCDDGGTAEQDGCDAVCSLEVGWACTGSAGETSVCSPICGDAKTVGTEGCDDANLRPQDGCSAACRREAGFVCTPAPSLCYVFSYSYTSTFIETATATGTADPQPAAFDPLHFTLLLTKGAVTLTAVPAADFFGGVEAIWQFKLSTTALCADTAGGTVVAQLRSGEALTFTALPLHAESEVVLCFAPFRGAAFEMIPGVFKVTAERMSVLTTGAHTAETPMRIHVVSSFLKGLSADELRAYRIKLSARQDCDTSSEPGGVGVAGLGTYPVVLNSDLTAVVTPLRDGVVYACLSSKAGVAGSWTALTNTIVVYPYLLSRVVVSEVPIGGMGQGTVAVDNPGSMPVTVRFTLELSNILLNRVVLAPSLDSANFIGNDGSLAIQIQPTRWMKLGVESSPTSSVICNVNYDNTTNLPTAERECSFTLGPLEGVAFAFYFTVDPATAAFSGVNASQIAFSADFSVRNDAADWVSVVSDTVDVRRPLLSLAVRSVATERAACEAEESQTEEACLRLKESCTYITHSFRRPRCSVAAALIAFEMHITNTMSDSAASPVEVRITHSNVNVRLSNVLSDMLVCREEGVGAVLCVLVPVLDGGDTQVVKVRFAEPSSAVRLETTFKLLAGPAWEGVPEITLQGAEVKEVGATGVAVGGGGGGGGDEWWYFVLVALLVVLCVVVVVLLCCLRKVSKEAPPLPP